MLTVNGPTTYYDYHGHGMGLQYLLCEKFAQQIGVSLRVEECKDTAEMVSKLRKGEGDLIAVPLARKQAKGGLLFCGVKTDDEQWSVAAAMFTLLSLIARRALSLNTTDCSRCMLVQPVWTGG